MKWWAYWFSYWFGFVWVYWFSYWVDLRVEEFQDFLIYFEMFMGRVLCLVYEIVVLVHFCVLACIAESIMLIVVCISRGIIEVVVMHNICWYGRKAMGVRMVPWPGGMEVITSVDGGRGGVSICAGWTPHCIVFRGGLLMVYALVCCVWFVGRPSDALQRLWFMWYDTMW